MATERDPLIGRVVRGYRVEAFVERGQGGSVYRGEQIAVGRKVALKVRRPRSERPLDAFLAPAREAARLVHAHIVPVLDVVEEGDVVFYSMEYLAGGSLAARVRAKGPLSISEVVKLLRGLADALHLIERSGSVHGDINPTHILFTSDGTPKILHVGAGVTCESSASSLPFAAPEKLEGSQPDTRSDLYELGACVHYASTGRLPFAGASVDELLRTKRCSAGLSPGDPPWLDTLVACMTRPDVAARCQSFAEVLQVVDEAASGDDGRGGGRRGSKPARRMPQAATRIGSARFARPIVFAAALLFVGLAIAAYIAMRPDEGDSEASRKTDPTAPIARESAGASSDATGPETGDPDAPGSRERPSLAEMLESDAGAGGGTRGAAATGDDRGETREPRAETEGDARGETGGRATSDAIERVRRRAREKFAELEEDWRSDPPSERELDVELARLEREYPDDVIRAEISALRRQVEARRRSIEALAKYSALIDDELREKRYAAALALRDPAIRDGLDTADWASEERSIWEQATRELATARTAVNERVRKGDYAEAIATMTSLVERLPPSPLLDEARHLLESLREAEARFTSVTQELSKVEGEVRAHLARADFEAAKRAMGERTSISHAGLAARFEAIADEIAHVEKAWNRLLGAWEKRAGAQRLELEILARASIGSPPYRLRELDRGDAAKPVLVIEDASRKRHRVPLLRLSTATLRLSLGLDPSKADADPTLVEGLGLVLEIFGGPGRAWPLLVASPALAPEARARHRERLLRRIETELSAELSSLTERTAALASSSSASSAARDWDALCDRAVDLWFRYGGASAGEISDRLEAAVESALTEAWSRRDPESLFAGRARVRSNGEIQLTYDFSSPRQADDFVLSPHGTNELAIEGAELRLKGECRILRGDPFLESFEISLVVAAYDERDPNIDIALFTKEGDWVSYPGTPKENGVVVKDAPSAPDDFLAFGIGYRPMGTTALFLFPYGETRVGMPCFTILGGRHGHALHRVYREKAFECYWAETVNRRVRGPQAVSLVLSPRRFHWTTNHLQIHDLSVSAVPLLRRVLENRKATPTSIHLFTNGQEIRIKALGIESVLDPQWRVREAKRRATLEWKRIAALAGVEVEAGGPAPVPAADS